MGTVSHGIKCAYPNLPGVYMRMTYYKPWIEKVTGEKFQIETVIQGVQKMFLEVEYKIKRYFNELFGSNFYCYYVM